MYALILHLKWLSAVVMSCWLRSVGPAQCLVPLLLLTVGAYAQEGQAPLPPVDLQKAAEQLQTLGQAVADDKVHIEQLRQEVDTLSTQQPGKAQALQVGQVTAMMVEQAKLDSGSIQLRQESVQAATTAVERRIGTLKQTIQQLEGQEQLLKNPAKETTEGGNRLEQLQSTSATLNQQRAELKLQQQNWMNLQELAELLVQRGKLAGQWQTRIEEIYRLQEEQSRREQREDRAKQLQQELQGQLNKVNELRAQLGQQGESLTVAGRGWLETRIQDAEERAVLLRWGIYYESLVADELARWSGLIDKTEVKPLQLQEGVQRLGSLHSELQSIYDLGQGKIDLFNQKKKILEQREATGADNRLRLEEISLVEGLLEELDTYQGQTKRQLEPIQQMRNRLETLYKERLSQDLSAREQLPGTAKEWQDLWTGLREAPSALLHQVRLSIESALEAIGRGGIAQWLSLLALGAGLVGAMVALLHYLNRPHTGDENERDDSFLARFLLAVQQLLRRNLRGSGVVAIVLLTLWLFEAPQPGLGIITTLVLLWFGVKILINLAWLLLASPQLPPAKQQPHLYHQVCWLLLLGGLLSAIAILAHLSDLPKPVIRTFDRLFMVYWLLIFFPLQRIRRYVLDVLALHYAGQFWFVSLGLLSLLLPLSLLVASILGLAGYLNLAWTIGSYMLIVAATLVGWLLIRGLFNDLVVVLKNYALSHSNYGLLWTQDIISPLYNILELGLAAGAMAVLLAVFNWRGEIAFLDDALSFLSKPLLTLGSIRISLWSLIVTVATFLVVIWFGRWLRAITYRWIFAGVTDLGIRHSLSVFAQYFVVLLGILIILRLIGVGLTTLAVFAGAVGVGIGFGLQAIANNFISGVLLLIERPLRSGNIVQIGNYTGEITRIGIRSLVLRNWDRHEVIIPNSEVITHAFVNWTHSDQIVRTVLMIGVSYKADPHEVQRILEQVMSDDPEVLDEPEWSVLLWDFAESSLSFRVQYHVNMSQSNMIKVRSSVMFAIWDGLKKAGIEIPYPQRELHIKPLPQEVGTMVPVDTRTATLPTPEAAPGSRGWR